MLLEEIIINITFSITASIAFFYIYKKTHLNIMLITGTITYFALLIRIFNIQYNPITSIPNFNIFIIPQIFIILYMTYYTYKDGYPIISIMLIGIIIAAATLINIGHPFYGDLGILFSLILLIW